MRSRSGFGWPVRGAVASGVVAACAAALASGCIQSHDGLAARDGAGGAPSSRGGAGGMGGGWQPPVDGSVSEASAESGAGGSPFVPDGPRKLTLLHGVTDSPWIAFCFARVDSGTEVPARGSPLPAGGLEFGASTSVTSLPAIDLKTDAIRPYAVLSANADAVSGLTCTTIVALSRIPPLRAPPPPPILEAGPAAPAAPPSDAAAEGGLISRDGASSGDAARIAEAGRDAAPPPATDASPVIPGVRVAALPVIPGGQLALERSYLLVPSGCFGGPGVTDPSERSICGDSYSPDTPTLAPIVVALPRAVPAAKVGISFLNATPAFSFCDVRLSPGGGGDPLTVAVGVTTGALRPLSPSTNWNATDIAALGDSAAIRVFPSGAKDVAYDEPWSKTLAASSIPALEDGSAYTLVLIGPYPTFTKGRFWNAPLVTLVKN